MKKHGHAGKNPSPTYISWKMMIQRCTNPNREDYQESYGGRGIGVFFAWIGPGGFEQFLADVGERPDTDHCLGRLDHDGDYEPGNVVWQPIPDNCKTMESWENNIKEVDGVAMTLAEWADHLGILYASLLKRMWRGWGDDAFRYRCRQRRPKENIEQYRIEGGRDGEED